MNSNRLLMRIIALGVLAWGAFLGAGAYFNHDGQRLWWRPVIVLGCVAAFLGFWGGMLAARKARMHRQNRAAGD